MEIGHQTHCPTCGREIDHILEVVYDDSGNRQTTSTPIHKDDRTPLCPGPRED